MAEGNGSRARWPDEESAVSDLALEDLRQSATQRRRDIPAHAVGNRLVPADKLDHGLGADSTPGYCIPMAILAGDFPAAAAARPVVAGLLYSCRSRCDHQRAAVHPGSGVSATPGCGVR